jgi:hypothetical protein
LHTRVGEKSAPFTIFEDGTQVKATEEGGFVEIEERGFKVSPKGIATAYD